MTDHDLLRAALTERASRAPDPEVVLANTTIGIRRARSRRRATAVAGTVAIATAAIAAGVMVLDRQGPTQSAHQVQPATAPTQQSSTARQASPGQQLPTKPSVSATLPFTFTAPAGFRWDNWSVTPSASMVDLRNGTSQVNALLTPTAPRQGGHQGNAQPTTVRGSQAELRQLTPASGGPVTVQLVWQPAPGTWITVTSSSAELARSVADSITLTPSDPPEAGAVASLPAGLAVSYWGRGNAGMTTVMIGPDEFADKTMCATLNFRSGTAPNEVTTSGQGQRAPLSAPDADGVRHTPDGRILVRQLDQNHWAQASLGTSAVTAAQLRDIILAASAH
ncbi:hypothetical protein F0L68_09130 [Solihabitans fulvus]|uniref:Uncharacterized protein n=1 Tax=Solihabitans fulvus TaxID=1892852 RepID=A0A5B2XKE0_9PSEU|nr:hypothetical protein [Solihabitans fulvus]KAA2263823.1 hypothetical protein F0L68_09130 [Solihabitans fulvus]